MTRRLDLALGGGLAVMASAACSAEVMSSPEPAGSATSHHRAGDPLGRIDTRRPLPLLPMMANHQKANMRDHLVAVQEIASALASDDFAAVERATARIGFSESMGQMCSHMGSGAPGFTEQALDFHRAADRISLAARDRDRARVLGELGSTLQRCTSCHQVWKQQIVDEAEWERIRGGEPP